MRYIEKTPGWAMRLTERSGQRRTGNRITRWIKVSPQKMRIEAGPRPGLRPDYPVADNLVIFAPRSAG